jgi:phage protein D
MQPWLNHKTIIWMKLNDAAIGNGTRGAVLQGRGLASDGAVMPALSINPTMCSNWRAAFKDRPKHTRVEGQYLVKRKRRREPVCVEAGEGEAISVLPQLYGSQAEAKRARAKAGRALLELLQWKHLRS